MWCWSEPFRENWINKRKTKIEEIFMKKCICTACGYVYDPEKGDPAAGIEPGTPFEDLPDDYCCPLCGVGKEMFKELD